MAMAHYCTASGLRSKQGACAYSSDGKVRVGVLPSPRSLLFFFALYGHTVYPVYPVYPPPSRISHTCLSPQSSLPSKCPTQHRTKRPAPPPPPPPPPPPTIPAALHHPATWIIKPNPHTPCTPKAHLQTPHRPSPPPPTTRTRNTSMEAPHINNRTCLNSRRRRRSKVSAIHPHSNKYNNSGRPIPRHVIRWRRRWRVCSRVLRPSTARCAA